MFAKIDKKLLIILAIILVVVLIAGFFVYKYSKDVEKTVENTESEEIIEEIGEQGQEEPLINLEDIQIETQPGLPAQTGLTICVDECGNGVCQPVDPVCDDDLNCICAETEADCPDDCK